MNLAGLITALRSNRRAQLALAGGLIAVVVFAVALGNVARLGPGPGESPGTSPAGSQALVGYTLPRPSTTDVALVVADPAALSAREQAWLADLKAQFGLVDAVAAGSAHLDVLERYLTVFVVDEHSDLDAGALRDAFAAGLTVNLAGSAAAYRSQILASPAP